MKEFAQETLPPGDITYKKLVDSKLLETVS